MLRFLNHCATIFEPLCYYFEPLWYDFEPLWYDFVTTVLWFLTHCVMSVWTTVLRFLNHCGTILEPMCNDFWTTVVRFFNPLCCDFWPTVSCLFDVINTGAAFFCRSFMKKKKKKIVDETFHKWVLTHWTYQPVKDNCLDSTSLDVPFYDKW